MIKDLLHDLYQLLGKFLCNIYLIFWRLRDKVSPPKEDSILIVAHPDDDALFFHSYIKEKKPYVALMTFGWSIRRLHQFFKAMKYYGCKYRAYPLESAQLWEDGTENLEKLAQQVRECLALASFEECATHGESGEYGHKVHRRVYSAVTKNASCKILTTVDKELIQNYPLSEAVLLEKKNVFRTKYTSEAWCIEQYAIWMNNEHLEEWRENCR